MRECASLLITRRSSSSESVCSTATMSARGTMTSSAVSSWSARMLARSARSCGSISAAAASVSSMSSPSASRKDPSPLRCPRSPLSQLRRIPMSDALPPPPRPGAEEGSAMERYPAAAWPRRAAAGPGCPVRVGDAEPGKDGGFEPLHAPGVSCERVVVAQEMERAVHDEVGKMIGERLAESRRLAAARLEGDDDVAEKCRPPRLPCARGARTFRIRECREGKYVGRRVLPPIEAVEPADEGVVAEHKAELGSTRHLSPLASCRGECRRGGRTRKPGRVRERPAPTRARDGNLDLDARRHDQPAPPLFLVGRAVSK